MPTIVRTLLLTLVLAAVPRVAASQATAPLPAAPIVVPIANDDAAAYAALTEVPVDIARGQLAAIDAMAPATAALRRTWRERLAGLSISHSPFGIAVLLTGDDPVPEGVVQAADLAVPVTFTTGAVATLEQLRTALANGQAAIRAAVTSPPGMGIDQRTGEIVVVVANADLGKGRAALTARLHDIVGVPLRVRSIETPGLDLATPAPAEGGARLVGTSRTDGRRYVCTAGFVVTDGTRTGIATAAHCPDDIAFVDADRRETPLTFVGQWGWGYQDVQINASATPLPPYFLADTARTLSRPVTARRAAADTTTGDVVCHRGERTGYSCALVELTDFAPAGDLCGGACTPSWITVGGSHCGGGDSGSPVFLGTTAYGILKGGSYRKDGSCAFYFYMSTDYLPDGWHVLTASDPPPPIADDSRSSPGPMHVPG